MSINTSVGLPWPEHVTVSLFTGCVNLSGLVCCESVYSLKQCQQPGLQELCSAQSVQCFLFQSTASKADTEMEYIEPCPSQTYSHGHFLWSCMVTWDELPWDSTLWESVTSPLFSRWSALLSVLLHLYPACRLNFLSCSERTQIFQLRETWILSGFEAAVNQRFIVSVTSVNFVGKPGRSKVHLLYENKY